VLHEYTRLLKIQDAKLRKNHGLHTIAQICRAIGLSLQLLRVSTIGKKLAKQQYLLHVSSQYDSLTAEIGSGVWDTP